MYIYYIYIYLYKLIILENRLSWYMELSEVLGTISNKLAFFSKLKKNNWNTNTIRKVYAIEVLDTQTETL